MKQTASFDVEKDIFGGGVASTEGEWPNHWLVVLHHFSSTGIFPWSILDKGQQRNITAGAVSEGGAAGSPLHHPQTHSSENKQSLKLHQWEGSKGSLPPGTPRRGVGQNECWAWWTRETGRNEAKIAFGFKGKNGGFCEKAPEVKQMSDLTGPKMMIK